MTSALSLDTRAAEPPQAERGRERHRDSDLGENVMLH